jgi:hypothetical protein
MFSYKPQHNSLSTFSDIYVLFMIRHFWSRDRSTFSYVILTSAFLICSFASVKYFNPCET